MPTVPDDVDVHIHKSIFTSTKELCKHGADAFTLSCYQAESATANALLAD